MVDEARPISATGLAAAVDDAESARLERLGRHWALFLGFGLIVALLVIGIVQRGTGGTDRGPRS